MEAWVSARCGGFSVRQTLCGRKLWWDRSWCDYYAPQLYWSITAPQQSFPALLNWWIGENKQSRHLVPGIYTSRIGNSTRAFTVEQVESQVFVARYSYGSHGTIHFSMKALLENREGIADRLTANAYLPRRNTGQPGWTIHLNDSGVAIRPSPGATGTLVARCDQEIRRWCLCAERKSWEPQILKR